MNLIKIFVCFCAIFVNEMWGMENNPKPLGGTVYENPIVWWNANFGNHYNTEIHLADAKRFNLYDSFMRAAKIKSLRLDNLPLIQHIGVTNAISTIQKESMLIDSSINASKSMQGHDSNMDKMLNVWNTLGTKVRTLNQNLGYAVSQRNKFVNDYKQISDKLTGHRKDTFLDMIKKSWEVMIQHFNSLHKEIEEKLSIYRVMSIKIAQNSVDTMLKNNDVHERTKSALRNVKEKLSNFAPSRKDEENVKDAIDSIDNLNPLIDTKKHYRENDYKNRIARINAIGKLIAIR